MSAPARFTLIIGPTGLVKSPVNISSRCQVGPGRLVRRVWNQCGIGAPSHSVAMIGNRLPSVTMYHCDIHRLCTFVTAPERASRRFQLSGEFVVKAARQA